MSHKQDSGLGAPAPCPCPRALSRCKVGLGKAAALRSLSALRFLCSHDPTGCPAGGGLGSQAQSLRSLFSLFGRCRVPPGTAVVWLHPSSVLRLFRAPRLRKSKHEKPPGLAGLSAETPSFPATCGRSCSDPEMPNDPYCPSGRSDPAGAEPFALCPWQHPPCAPQCQCSPDS